VVRRCLVVAFLLLLATGGCSGAAGAPIEGADAAGVDGSSGPEAGGACTDPAGAADCTGKCGQWNTPCGALVTCGGCGAGQSCGGGGTPNVCGAGICIPGCAGKPCGASNGCDAPCTSGCGGPGDAGGPVDAGPLDGGHGDGGHADAGHADAGPVEGGSADDGGGPTCSSYGTYGCHTGSGPACCAGLGCDPYLDVCYVAVGSPCTGANNHCVGVENTTCLPSGVCGATSTCVTAGASCATAACCTDYPCTPFNDGSFVCETAGQCVPAGASCEIAPCCNGAGACTKTAAGAYFCGP
jgi:hypothetical protein